ncbi:MAG TPA: hypothetical protein VMT23_00730 [Candidatus Binatia bacterium]|nr:hypothetical protein [Candidatus Binatia bacterium]
MPEQILKVGEWGIDLVPENLALRGIIAESERQQIGSMQRQGEFRSAMGDFGPLNPNADPELDAIYQGITDYLEMLSMAPEARHAQHWEHMTNPAGLEKLNSLSGQTVLDLGNGQTATEFQGFIKGFGASGYIGVDIRNILGARQRQQIENFGTVGYLDAKDGDVMDGVLVRGDLLAVASRLPEKSVSIALNGIDEFIVKSSSSYGHRLVDEVVRILHPDGLILGLQSQPGILNVLAKRAGMDALRLSATWHAADRTSSGFYLITKRA